MKAKPVSRRRAPRYPTRMQALADRTLLERHQPPAWQSHAEMAGIVTLLLTTNASTSLAQKVERLAGKPAVVAPIFKHGEGRGAVGCVVINPPVFLSEQDAMQVIREELAKAGVTLSETKVPVGDVHITSQWSAVTLKGSKQVWSVPAGESKPLNLNAFDSRKNVGVEFVSTENYFDLGGMRSMASVQGYDFEERAGAVSETVRAKAHDIYFGAFYDPVTAWPRGIFGDRGFHRRLDAIYDERFKATNPKVIAEKDKEIRDLYDQKLAPARAESKRLLRMQVKDFVDWLKGQGVI